jgi:NDP-sugar pyrophosphorylase family protein
MDKLFFDLSSYAHKSLFEKLSFPWEIFSSLEEYFSKHTLGKIESPIPSTAYIENIEKVSIGKGTVIEPGAYIKGPCIIGKSCTIRHTAYVRGFVIVGDNCLIGHGTEIKKSVLFDGVHAAHFAYIGDSILGNRVHLGAGVCCANFRLDSGEIYCYFQGKKIPTRLRKLGAIIGDDTKIGCNSVINPGTLIGKNSWVSPSINIQGFIEPSSFVKPSKTVMRSL